MTAPASTGTVVPWKVRWALAAAAAAAVLIMPGTVKAIGERGIHNAAHILGINNDTPIELDPPVVTP